MTVAIELTTKISIVIVVITTDWDIVSIIFVFWVNVVIIVEGEIFVKFELFSRKGDAAIHAVRHQFEPTFAAYNIGTFTFKSNNTKVNSLRIFGKTVYTIDGESIGDHRVVVIVRGGDGKCVTIFYIS